MPHQREIIGNAHGTEHLPQRQRMSKHLRDWAKGSVGLALVALPFAALIQLV